MYINQPVQIFLEILRKCLTYSLDNDAVNLLTNETIIYASQKGNHQFSITPGEMRAFIGIPFLSSYCIVPRRRLYWPIDSKTHNRMIAI